MTKQLLPLAIGGLAIGTTEFIIMGLLPDVAKDLGVSIPVAGHLISAYAFGVVVGAPILVALSSKFPPKNILIVYMILFTLFNALSIVAPDYNTLLMSRFLAGLPHGAFFGVGTIVAIKLATKGKEAQAVSSMFTGLTLAILFVVPILTYIGHITSYKWAFFAVSFLGAITVLSLFKFMPKLKSLKTVTFKEEIEFFLTFKAWNIILIVAIGFGGLFAWFSYIAPLLINVSKFDPSSISYLMLIAGIGMVLGNILGGYLADKKDPIKVAIYLLSFMVFFLLLVFFLSENKTISLVLTFICGVFAMSIGTPINMVMVKNAKNSEMLGAAFIQAAFNVANSLGALFGGIPLLFGFNYNYPALVGAFMAFLGAILCMIFYKKYHS
ncbi:MFS transporter [Aliarcobacter cibarius]|uniref:Major facilitator superfamily transporter n=1 Tax=Aliarcobacter cibarius TaxID=255507 RepID=A0A7L5JMY1_9BACT|nr:MFS transporter [Aliarcobacter cibarius]QKJ26552.1 major facilitator superfamily transporter [Aliarcobacter cibarius]TLT03730.1 MFS transporter [Aliarcobacter cibarius]